jgi:hypothetical protein
MAKKSAKIKIELTPRQAEMLDYVLLRLVVCSSYNCAGKQAERGLIRRIYEKIQAARPNHRPRFSDI